MNKQLQILLSGALVVVPFAITAYVIWGIAVWVDGLGQSLLGGAWPEDWYMPGIGVLIVLVAIYLVGLLTHFWLFQKLLDLAEKAIGRVPGIKTIYESVRDLLQLFGGDSKRMGRVVEYHPPGADCVILGILTNEAPLGRPAGAEKKVSVYFPFGYMVGGPVVYVPPEHLQEVDMPVELALKLAATAHVGAPSGSAPADDEKSPDSA